MAIYTLCPTVLILLMLIVLLAGFAGGLLRGILGIAKDLVTKKDVTINWLWFGITIAVAGIIGVITASFFSDDLRIAALGGYSGSDLIEGIFKLKINQLFIPKPAAADPPPAKPKTGNFGDLLK